LYDNRAPGNTCFSALSSFLRGAKGTIEEPINDSKGCGGVMRVAPIGIYFGGKKSKIEDVDMIAAESAAITHGHDLGYIPAASLVHIIHLVSHDKDITLLEAVHDMIATMEELFANARHIIEFTDLMEKAVMLSGSNVADIDAIHMLGEGWVAEETLAIAIYCALKYPNDFKKAVVTAVNHKGDSDSTGAVTGNILGAYLGLSAIPSQYLENLELKNVILELADDLYNDCQISEYSLSKDEIWENKYLYQTYKPKT
jgi:ADP-ribosylglycohydrolase